ncbi:hypothetical protein B0J12DRAFT_705600 [Macrophomina phaseolina]|uniref:Uncharacterized protein n=1 Tax=Macrophomina phaseolina TaxID=35725 RepID=A0ABQ8FRP4_9PEZI|nr:hypothetical protein B0J12DRAFT_705600 [Macrophomina phaseolina]
MGGIFASVFNQSQGKSAAPDRPVRETLPCSRTHRPADAAATPAGILLKTREGYSLKAIKVTVEDNRSSRQDGSRLADQPARVEHTPCKENASILSLSHLTSALEHESRRAFRERMSTSTLHLMTSNLTFPTYRTSQTAVACYCPSRAARARRAQQQPRRRHVEVDFDICIAAERIHGFCYVRGQAEDARKSARVRAEARHDLESSAEHAEGRQLSKSFPVFYKHTIYEAQVPKNLLQEWYETICGLQAGIKKHTSMQYKRSKIGKASRSVNQTRSRHGRSLVPHQMLHKG